MTPRRLHDLVDAFAQTTQAVIDLGSSCGTDDLAQPTDCPGWTRKVGPTPIRTPLIAQNTGDQR
ncbi:MAG: hypothetical protein ACYDDU_06165 [Dermatophilaceae bacterium]